MAYEPPRYSLTYLEKKKKKNLGVREAFSLLSLEDVASVGVEDFQRVSRVLGQLGYKERLEGFSDLVDWMINGVLRRSRTVVEENLLN